VIRELTIDSETPVAPSSSGRVRRRTSPTPRDEAVGRGRGSALRGLVSRINEELASDGFRPPTVINLALKLSYDGVAMAGGGRITGSVKFFKATRRPGRMIHETCHSRPALRSRNNPGWLVEGVADYVRFYKYSPPARSGRINAELSLQQQLSRLGTVPPLPGRQVRPVDRPQAQPHDEGGEVHRRRLPELTGKDLKALDDEWRANLKAASPRVSGSLFNLGRLKVDSGSGPSRSPFRGYKSAPALSKTPSRRRVLGDERSEPPVRGRCLGSLRSSPATRIGSQRFSTERRHPESIEDSSRLGRGLLDRKMLKISPGPARSARRGILSTGVGG